MTVNGKPVSLDAPMTVGQFLESQGYNPARVAVEQNGEIVRRADFDTRTLADTDTLEIVQFVGGG